MPLTLRTLTSASFCVLLAACGGGGSDGDGAASLNYDVTTVAATADAPPASVTPSNDKNYQFDATARFKQPGDIAVAANGDLYVLDRGNRTIRRIAANGEASTLAHAFDAPRRMEIDAAGNLFILTERDIFRVGSSGDRTLMASYPAGPESAYPPLGIAVDGKGRLYVLLRHRTNFWVERIDPDLSARTVFSYGSFGEFSAVASDAEGNLALLTDGPAPDSDRLILVPAAAQPASTPYDGVRFETLQTQVEAQPAMKYDDAGNLLIADLRYEYAENRVAGMRVQRRSADGGTAVLFSGFPDGAADARPVASFADNAGLAYGPGGELFLSDPFSHAIYRINAAGKASVYAGKAGEAGSAD